MKIMSMDRQAKRDAARLAACEPDAWQVALSCQWSRVVDLLDEQTSAEWFDTLDASIKALMRAVEREGIGYPEGNSALVVYGALRGTALRKGAR